MEKAPLNGEAGAQTATADKKPHDDSSHTDRVANVNIGNNPPQVVEGVIKKVLSALVLIIHSCNIFTSH
jgi:hypothetical protein